MGDNIITTERGVKLAITITGATCIAYFSGPFAAIVAREVFTGIYDYRYGIPSFLSVENFTIYSPLKEHVGHLAYNYGAGTLAVLSTPILYKSWDLCKWALGFSKRNEEEIEREQISELSEGVSTLDVRLVELAKLLKENKSVAEQAAIQREQKMITIQKLRSSADCVLETASFKRKAPNNATGFQLKSC